VPRLSHQLPVDVVLTVVLTAAVDVVAVGMMALVVAVVVVVRDVVVLALLVVEGVVVVLDVEEQDVNNVIITMINDNSPQNALLFI
jgi:hypothetical protein